MSLQERIVVIQEKLALNNQEMAEELRITPEWIGKILNGRVRCSDDIGLRLDELCRSRGIEPNSIFPAVKTGNYPNLGKQHSGLVEDDKAKFGVSSRPPMRITPGHEIPAKEPSEQDCLKYLASYLAIMRTTPGGLGHTFIELQRHFPLPRPTEIESPQEQGSSRLLPD